MSILHVEGQEKVEKALTAERLKANEQLMNSKAYVLVCLSPHGPITRSAVMEGMGTVEQVGFMAMAERTVCELSEEILTSARDG